MKYNIATILVLGGLISSSLQCGCVGQYFENLRVKSAVQCAISCQNSLQFCSSFRVFAEAQVKGGKQCHLYRSTNHNALYGAPVEFDPTQCYCLMKEGQRQNTRPDFREANFIRRDEHLRRETISTSTSTTTIEPTTETRSSTVTTTTSEPKKDMELLPGTELYENAFKACDAKGLQLVEIRNQEQEKQVSEFIKGNNVECFYMGIYQDKNQWRTWRFESDDSIVKDYAKWLKEQQADENSIRAICKTNEDMGWFRTSGDYYLYKCSLMCESKMTDI